MGGIVVQLLRVRARKWPIYPVQPVRRNTHNMTSNFYQKWALHTPVPQGPHVVGCADILVGKTAEGTLMRLFYPSKVKDLQSQKENWTPWHLGDEYTRGLATFIAPAIPSLFSMLFNWQTGSATTAAVWEPPMAEGKFPIVVFAHGLGANRSIYSTVCSELASHGFAVAAIEHRDSSACASFTINDKGEKEFILFKALTPGTKEYELRNSQLKVRVKEGIRALDVLEKLNKGGVKNDLPSTFDLEQLAGRLDLSKPIMAGHSFGGATTLCILAEDKRFTMGVALDPWMFPIKVDIDTLAPKITQPLLCINTEAFQAEANMNAMRKLNLDTTTFVTIKGTVHQNQCDTPYLVGPIGRIFAGASSPLDPLMANDINNRIMINYICKQLGMKPEFCNQYEAYLENHKDKVVHGLHGTGKGMLGWDPGYNRI
nr:platelet-activating factor acetylhydrolase 2, cytoplasmic-like isoform X1 [Penaeus vannamei]XP_027220092.1 platelet-activating factor acetylhydrolase 2, cytoplasmic-like isoform X1 [Penaeus vannamei]